jgi:hypothetical protein
MSARERADFTAQLAASLIGQALVGLDLPQLDDQSLDDWVKALATKKNSDDLADIVKTAGRGHYPATRALLEQFCNKRKPLPSTHTHGAGGDE